MNGRVVISTKISTVSEVYARVGEETIHRWETLGKMDSDIHWAYGQEAKDLIERYCVPSMLAYTAIGRKAGKSSQTIRKSFYTYKTFTDAQREQYHTAPYSVFAHARTCDDPEAVLQYYADERCGVDEIEAVFRQGDDIEFMNEFRRSKFPQYLVGAYRRLMGLPEQKRKEAERLLRRFIEVVK